MSKAENDRKASSSANSKKLALVLMAAAFMLCGGCIAAVGTESTDATIQDGDTGYIHTTWESGDCVVTYDSQWVQRDSEGLVQYGDGVLKVSGNGRMGDYFHVEHSAGTTTPWTDTIRWYSPYYGCTKLIIEEGVTHIGSCAFFSMGFSEVVLPSTLISIGDNAFEKTKLTSLVIPDTVTKIGDEVFKDCTRLTSVTLPNGITELGLRVFDGAPFTQIDLPKSIRALNGTFYNSGITSIVIPEGVTKIAENTFAFCKDLKTVVIPDSVTVIDGWSFNDSGITEIRLDNIESIGNDAFAGCKALKCVVLPSSLKSIALSVFSGCSALEYAYLPDSLKEIPSGTFKDCTSLKSIVLPDSIETIGGHAFASTSLEYVNIPDKVTSIGSCAFSNTNLTTVVIPASVKSIGMFAFVSQTLKYVSFEGTDVDIAAFGFLCQLETFNTPVINDPEIDKKGVGQFSTIQFYDTDKTTEINANPMAIGGYTWTSVGMSESGCVYKIADPKPETLNFTWLNYDGTVLQKTSGVPLNEWPTYQGEDPVNEFGLTFCGWSSVEDRFGNVLLMATFQVGDVTDVGGDDGMSDDDGDDTLIDKIGTKVKGAVGKVKGAIGKIVDVTHVVVGSFHPISHIIIH